MDSCNLGCNLENLLKSFLLGVNGVGVTGVVGDPLAAVGAEVVVFAVGHVAVPLLGLGGNSIGLNNSSKIPPKLVQEAN